MPGPQTKLPKPVLNKSQGCCKILFPSIKKDPRRGSSKAKFRKCVLGGVETGSMYVQYVQGF